MDLSSLKDCLRTLLCQRNWNSWIFLHRFYYCPMFLLANHITHTLCLSTLTDSLDGIDLVSLTRYCILQECHFHSFSGRNARCDICDSVLFLTVHSKLEITLISWCSNDTDYFLEEAYLLDLALLNFTLWALWWFVEDLINAVITSPSCSPVVNYSLSLCFLRTVHLSLLGV